MIPSEEKKVLRKSLMDEKFRVSAEEVKNYSRKILNTLSECVDWGQINKIHAYLPIKKYNEVDTTQLIDFIRQNHPNIQIEIAPSLSKSKDISDGNDYDLVVIPVLGFDRRGYRLGYGGGYYDKFLAKNKCKQIIGLSYSFSEIDRLPSESHDKRLQKIITEKEIINIKY